MREVLVASLCEEIGEKWDLLENIYLTATEIGASQVPIILVDGDALRLGWFRLVMQISRSFVDESLQKHLIRKRLRG